MDRHHPPGAHARGEHGHDVLQRVRREGRWWWLQARHARRIWRWTLLVAVVLFVALALFRRPLADWFWAEPRIEQVLEQADAALAAGRLSAADGSGARELFQAALALDGDRRQAREGLQRTGTAALRAAETALQADDVDAAAAALALAGELQVPRASSDAFAQRLRERRAAGAGLDVLLRQAQVALSEGRLDEGDGAALPLLKQVLDLRPDDVAALEMREDALADLLARARQASARGDVQEAAQVLHRARLYDAGHVDLPSSQEALSQALESRLRHASAALDAGRLDAALERLLPALLAAADDPAVVARRDRLLQGLLQDSRRLARDFQFEAAEARIAQAAQLQAGDRELGIARQDMQRARAAQDALDAAAPASASQRRELARLLERVADAEARGRFLAPPGDSAFDALREAQALAPRDRRVHAAAERLLPASRTCFEDALRQNRVEAAGGCLQAWQTLAPTDAALGPARSRLAQRWLAVGSERLGNGDLAFAERAASQARRLQPSLPELDAFEARVRQAGGERR